MNILSNLNLNFNQLINARMQIVTSLEGLQGTPGQFIFCSADNKFYGFNGAKWVDLSNVPTADFTPELEAALNGVVAGLAKEIVDRETADSELASRLDVIEGELEGSIKKALADAKAYTDEKITQVNNSLASLNTIVESKADQTELDDTNERLSNLESAIGLSEEGEGSIVDRIGTLETGLAKEIGDRESEIERVEGLVTAETTARENADNLLDGKISAVASDLASEITRAKQAESDLQTAINVEQSRAEAAELALGKKVDGVVTDLATEVTARQNLESSLGSAAFKEVGTASGQVVTVGENGKIAESVLPRISINNTFVVESPEEAMAIEDIHVGDVVVLNETSSRVKAIIDTFNANQALVARGAKVTKIATNSTISEKTQSYIAAGQLAFICVDATGETFDERFRPLATSAGVISKAEVEALIAQAKEVLDNKDTELDGKIAANTAAINAESERAKGIEAGLRTDVDKNTADLSAEVARAKAEELKLAGEVTRVEGKVDAEVVRATAEETAIREELSAVNTDLIGKINAVDTKADTNASNLAELSTLVNAHINNEVIHVTQEDKDKWNERTKKQAVTIAGSDNEATKFIIAHTLVSEDIHVSIKDTQTKEIVFVSTKIVDENKIELEFGIAPKRQYTVVVIG